MTALKKSTHTHNKSDKSTLGSEFAQLSKLKSHTRKVKKCHASDIRTFTRCRHSLSPTFRLDYFCMLVGWLVGLLMLVVLSFMEHYPNEQWKTG